MVENHPQEDADAADDGLAEERTSRIFRDSKPYGDPIMGALATGDINEMRRVAAFAETWLSNAESEIVRVREALDQLRAAMSNLEPDAPTE